MCDVRSREMCEHDLKQSIDYTDVKKFKEKSDTFVFCQYSGIKTYD